MDIFEELLEMFKGNEKRSKPKIKTIKKLRLDSLDKSADDETKKLYGYLTHPIKDKKYFASDRKTDTYIRVYNQFHEWPDFMQKWIKEEYVYLQALKLTNMSLNSNKNDYSGQLLRIVNDLDSGEAKQSIDSLLDRLDSGQIYVDEHFFNDIRYAMRQSSLTINEYSRLQILLNEWSDVYAHLLAEKKNHVKSQV